MLNEVEKKKRKINMHKKNRIYGLLRLTLKLMAILLINCGYEATASSWYFETETCRPLAKVKMHYSTDHPVEHVPVIFSENLEPKAYLLKPAKTSYSTTKLTPIEDSVRYVSPGVWVARFRIPDYATKSTYFGSHIQLELTTDVMPFCSRCDNDSIIPFADCYVLPKKYLMFNEPKPKYKPLSENAEFKELTNKETGLKIKLWSPKQNGPNDKTLNRTDMAPPSGCCCSIQ